MRQTKMINLTILKVCQYKQHFPYLF
ncbi:hypothetical protein, partial [Plasmodium yoelii yoelii]